MSRKTWAFWSQLGLLVATSTAALSAGPLPQQPQEPADKPKPKKVWTDDDVKGPAAKPAAATAAKDPAKTGSAGTNRIVYNHEADPKWYARELQPLRQELAKIDTDIRSLQEARKDGKGASDTVSLEDEPEGVSTDAQMDLLTSRRGELLHQIDDLEEQARHNAIAPGDLQNLPLAETENEAVVPSGIDASTADRVEKQLAQEIADAKSQLRRSNTESELLRRDLRLQLQQEGSDPEPHSRRDPAPQSAQTSELLDVKHVETADLEKKIAELEDELKEEQLNAPASLKNGSAKNGVPQTPSDDALENAADAEAQWRAQFASIDYKIRIARTELDILQRELNLDLTQYTPNPATTMKESITRKQINGHRKAIDDKKKELSDLNALRAQLEDELRRAGGPAGWSRP